MVQLLIEERRATFRFFAVSLALVAVTAWAVYNELETRRPWKKYQREFFALERAATERALAEAEQKLAASPARDRLAKIDADLAQARKNLENAEFQTARRDLEDQTARHNTMLQALSFLRSERDEAFYRWKLTVHEDREDAGFKERFAGLDAEVKRREREVEDQAAAGAEAQQKLDQYTDKVSALMLERDKITAERDRLLSQLALIADKKPRIEQVMLPELDAMDRCQTCHPASDRAGFDGKEWPEPFRTHPDREVLLGKVHPVARFGCTACHLGQGPQLKGIGSRPFDHGRSDPYWDRPMLEKPFTESSCPACHNQEWGLDAAPALNQGKELFADLACAACHLTAGFENQRRIGPNLTALAAKVRPDWLVAWLAAPRNLRTRTAMPHTWTGANNEPEVQAVAAFLLNASEPKPLAPLPGATPADPARGKKLFVDRGCAGCHQVASIPRPEPVPDSLLVYFGPDLDGIGTKLQSGWIMAFLADPAAWYSETRMPNSILAAPDRADLAAFLEAETTTPFPTPPDLTGPDRVAEGRRLVGLYGCFACHQIPGFEAAPRVAPELNGFGDKAPSLLSFGDTVTNHAGQTWERWTKIKLTSPRAFRTERENLVMPDNGLDPGRVLALMVHLKSLRSDRFADGPRRALSESEARSEAGERLFQEYNCLGCHLENGRGGQARRLFADPGLYPPDLTGEGAKVQPAWLFQFLKKPTALRPWLTMRMPEFGLSDQSAQDLVYYLMTRAKQADLLLEVPAAMEPELYAATEQVFVKLQCLSCHQLTLGPAQKLSDLAPDMGLTRYRLRPQWMLEFIIDPQRLMPGTKMPNFFPLEDDEDPESIMTPFPDWLSGDARAQVRAVRDYLYVMKQSANPVALP